MRGSRPLQRPAVVLERATIRAGGAPTFAVSRAALLALAGWQRLGYVCIAVDHQVEVPNDRARVRAEMALQREIDAALRGAGGRLAATYVYPRPGEDVDADVPRASVFARLLMEAAVRHRIDRPRSLFVARTPEAIEGARIAGIPCGLLLGEASARESRPAVRPDFLWPDFAAVAALVDQQRQRAAAGRG